MKPLKTILPIALILFLMQVSTGLQAQIRVGGNIAPNPNAILDLNINETDDGTRGLLLPRVALVSTTDANPLSEHIAGMLVFNTATSNDVTPGVYYNDGESWIRGFGEARIPDEPSLTNIREAYVEINETIHLNSVRYHGEIRDLDPSMTILGIRGEFSDPSVVQRVFNVTTFLNANADGTAITWSLHVQNLNFDPEVSSVLERVIITYNCPHSETPQMSFLGSFAFVGW